MRLLFSLLFLCCLWGIGWGQQSDATNATADTLRDTAVQNVIQPLQKISPKWGIVLPAEALLKTGAQRHFLAQLEQHPQWNKKNITWAVARDRPFTNRAAEFYLLLLLLCILGLVRAGWPRYFPNLWRAFWQGGNSSPALRTQLEDAVQPALLMNGLFALTGGAYIYYLSRLYSGAPLGRSPAGAFAILVGGVAAIYLFKWAAIQASGWVFGVKSLTNSYLFNVFLINKIMTVALLPLTVLLAFTAPVWAVPVAAISLALVAALLLLRYVRSWPTLRAFFNNSHFHFLTYFCASEILPLAILTKLLLPYLRQ